MEMKGLLQNRLMGRTAEMLSQGLKFRSANHNVIGGNLANMDTPGYRPRDLDFNQELNQAMDKNALQLKKTNSEHFSHYSGRLDEGKDSFKVRERETESKINLDREMAKMIQNNIQYEAYAKLLAKKFASLKTAIDSGRR